MRQNFRIMMEDLSVESSRNYQMKQCYDPAVVPEEMLLVMTTAYAQPGMKEVWEDGVERLLDLKAIAPYRILHRLEQLHADTLVIWGRQDVGAIHESAVSAVQRLPKAKLVTLEKCGHRPMLEHPNLFNGEVRSFLRSGS
jgi:pimeloyl-ACP methyl ester carboxylesterase